MCGFLFAPHSNCGRIFSSFDTIHERDGQTLHGGIGRAYACIKRQLDDCIQSDTVQHYVEKSRQVLPFRLGIIKHMIPD